MRAFPLLLALSIALVPGASLAHVTLGHGGATCGGTAPATTSCSTGEHLMTVNNHLEVDFRGTGAYTGTLEATLTQGRNVVYVVTCDYASGVETGCTTSGAGPTPGLRFTHDCRSLDAGTTTPGGSGPWTCRIYHVVV